jgi:hypothetical protein
MDAGNNLFGLSGAQAVIAKNTNAPGTGSNVISGFTDSYVVDAVVIYRHADDSYTTYADIADIHLKAEANNTYVIYAPRVFVSKLDNVLLNQRDGLYGFYTRDTFMATFNDVQCSGNYNDIAGSVGMWWDDGGDGGSGTSCILNRCWVRDGVETAYKARGLAYSVFNACGTDRWVKHALDVELCDITLNGFGFENRVTPGTSPFKLRYSRITMNNIVGFTVNVANGSYLIDQQGGVVNVSGIRQTTTAAGVGLGRAYRVADEGILNISGQAISSSLGDLTTLIESNGTFVDLDNCTRSGENKSYNTVGGDFNVKDASGDVKISLSPIFTNSGRVQAANNLYLGSNDELTLYMSPTELRPENTDGVVNLGSGLYKYNTVYAATGSISTSDRNKKQDIGDISDAILDAWGKVNYQTFKFKDAVELKGDGARYHIGVIAQEIHDAFTSTEGAPNPFDYGILCYEEWDAVEEELNDEGEILTPSREAGDMWAIRADECLFLESAYMRRELNRLKATL